MKAITAASALLLTACSTTGPAVDASPASYDLSANAQEIAPDQVLVEAALVLPDGQEVFMPRVLMGQGPNTASVYVGDAEDMAPTADGVHGTFFTEEDHVLVEIKVVEAGADVWSQDLHVPITAAADGSLPPSPQPGH